MNFKVVNAKSINLGSKGIQKISEVTLEDGNLGYRSPKIVRDSINKGFFLVALDESNELLGWIEKYKIWKDWWGLSTLYVYPEYRDFNIGRGTLIPAGVKQLKGRNIFAATTNKDINPVLEELGFGFYKAKNINVMMVKDASLNLECKLVKEIDLGDHTLFVGEVIAININEKDPLPYFNGKYWKFDTNIEKPAQEELDRINNVTKKYSK